ncbi:MAG: hypothetical protein WCD79_01895 [Chthoniobacteraceae bacterium]
MTSADNHFDGALQMLLTFDVGRIGIVDLMGGEERIEILLHRHERMFAL